MNITQKLTHLTKLAVYTFLMTVLLASQPSFAANETALADKPIFSGKVTGNVALSLSVEWPTAVVSAYKDSYTIGNDYLGYFDSKTCYDYIAGTQYLTAFNTGVNASGASLSLLFDDTHWTSPIKPSSSDVNNVMQSNDSNSAFIGSSNAVSAGDYYYQTNFTIPSTVDPTKVSISFNVTADDGLKNILINCSTSITSCTANKVTGITAGNTATSINIAAGQYPFTTGLNTLTLVANNFKNAFNLNTSVRLLVDELSVKAVSDNGSYFSPAVNNASNHVCTGKWSGNYLNWALTPVIDPLRFALTGGYRVVDKVGMTILEKAYGEEFGEGNTPNKTLTNTTLISNSTPYSGLTNLTIKSHGLGNKFYITSLADVENPGLSGGLLNDSQLLSSPSTTRVYEMFARNQVCKTGVLEQNCVLYPNGDYKPTGLIQKNASKLRFAAFGYLKHDVVERDGGVLRAKMAAIGPTGDLPEWSADTGIFITNPDVANADASGVTNSGVINYLNKFGQTAPGYKNFDPVSELYYATGRYFRNKGNVTSYTADATPAMKDGFPVINTWTDPIQFSCEANFIIGVGDTNSHADANLPGSTLNNSTLEPTLPSQVNDDFGSLTNKDVNYTDVRKSTNYVGALQGVGNLGETYTKWGCCSNNTYFMAGLAYDLHTRDFRPDLSDIQTITTYWLDTLEVGERTDEGGLGNRNQFWLAAKYGGFNVPKNYDPYSSTLKPPAAADWDANNDGSPDNYFRANEPSLMISGLNQAFDGMVSKVNAISTGFSLTSPNVGINDLSFAAKYDAEFWTGTVTGNQINFNSGSPVPSEVWTTDTKFEYQAAGAGWSTQRSIATAKCSAKDSEGKSTCIGTKFRYGDLNANDQTAINTVGVQTNVGNDAINYLRGDRSREGVFRIRKKLLGDIVNSQIRAVGQPNAPYSETSNPGYQNFKSTNSNRSAVAYVGANDGMLHAFKGSDGTELFAYVPNALFQGPSNTPNDNGLAALAKTTYAHHAYVDSSPVVFDVNFGTDKAPDWHSLLIGGLGKGGKSYYALDVTNPDSMSNETTLASKVQWEFTHKDLGYSYGRPVVVKAGGKWLVILTSGYNNADGKGYFFILNAKTGALISKVGISETYTTDAGLAHATAFIADGRDFTADAAYAGDLHGNVWRLDLTDAANDNFPTATKIAQLASANNDAQPITVSPMVEVDQSTNKRYVFIGTGKLLSDADIPTTNTQSFYAILDGMDKAFFNSSTLPSAAAGQPASRNNMVNHTNNPNSVTEDTAKPMGYYIDFDAGFRVTTPLDTSAGIIAFAANKVGGNQCNVDAEFRGYALNYGSGKSLLMQNGTTTATQYYSGKGVVTGIAIYKKTNSTNVSVNYSSTDPTEPNKTLDTQSAAANFQLLNWRSIPNND